LRRWQELGPQLGCGPTSAEVDPLRPERWPRTEPNLAIAGRRTGAEADPTVAKSRTGAEGGTPIPIRSGPIGHAARQTPARIGVCHPRDRPARSDIRHARGHRLGVGHNRCWGLE